MKVANLKLIVPQVAPVEVFEVADLEKCPRGALREQVSQVPVPLVDCLPRLSQHDFKDDLVALVLEAVDDAERVFVFERSRVVWKCQDKIVLANLRQSTLSVHLGLLNDPANPSEGQDKELFDSLAKE